jgi:hypothetical protein
MPRESAKFLRLTDRDYEIFQHLLRYRLSTREILHRLFFSDSDINAVTKVTSRLEAHGYLNNYELYAPRRYFVLGPNAARMFGLSLKKTREMGPQTKAHEYGVLAFCTLPNQLRERLMVREIHERYPQLLTKGIDSSHYYLDNDGEVTRLGYIRVDQGGPPDHVVRKCRADLEARLEHKPFAELIDGQRFLIAVVTATEPKARAIHEALKRHAWPIRFRIEGVPDLVHLIARYDRVVEDQLT